MLHIIYIIYYILYIMICNIYNIIYNFVNHYLFSAKKIMQLNNSGQVKTFAVKNEIKDLEFEWNDKYKAWRKETNEKIINKIKFLKVVYNII